MTGFLEPLGTAQPQKGGLAHRREVELSGRVGNPYLKGQGT